MTSNPKSPKATKPTYDTNSIDNNNNNNTKTHMWHRWNHPPAPLQVLWGPLKLRVFCTTFRHSPMNQQTWSEIHLNIKETVRNDVKNEDAGEEDLKAIKAKKMWWHAMLECRVIEVYSKEALD